MAWLEMNRHLTHLILHAPVMKHPQQLHPPLLLLQEMPNL
jgi:hypothetical protein